jgi:hypothetical protein
MKKVLLLLLILPFTSCKEAKRQDLKSTQNSFPNLAQDSVILAEQEIDSLHSIKGFLDYFPDLQNENLIMDTRTLWHLNTQNPLDTVIALKYFFDNDTKKMHDIYQAYNMDENTYTDVPYIKEIYPLYKIKHKEIYLLCYDLVSIINLMFYDYKNDKIISDFAIGDNSAYEEFLYSTIFPNNYIVTIDVTDKSYYILSKIDYETQKIIELKRLKIDKNQTDNDLESNAFEALGISRTGELLEDNEENQ